MVCVLERDEEKCTALAQLGSRVHVVQGDATSAADNPAPSPRRWSASGALDTLATFVGIFDNYTPLAEIPRRPIRRCLRGGIQRQRRLPSCERRTPRRHSLTR